MRLLSVVSGLSFILISAFSAQAAPFSLKGAAASGFEYKAEAYGVSMKFPAGWVHREENDAIYLGSNTEPGLVAVWSSAEVSVAALTKEFEGALALVGSFTLGAPTTLKDGNRTFHVWDAKGTAGSGGEAGARCIAAASSEFAVLIVGVVEGAPAVREAMSARADTMARTVKFEARKPGAAAAGIAGQWWSYSGTTTLSGGGGSERTVALCPDGRYFEQYESGYYGAGWGTAGQGSGGGRWKAVGSAQSGTVYVTTAEGENAEYGYTLKKADELVLGTRTYGRVDASLCR